MADPVEEDWQEREQRAVLALDAYRERRRERRGGDTYFGSAELLEHAEEVLSKAEHERRRIEIMNDAAAAGMPPELAEMLYDIAREERLDPALGFELVHSGLGVAAPLDGVSNAPVQPTTDKYAPEWLGAPIGADELLRERTLRLSFRRLRGLLEKYDDPAEAFRAFAREPDVEPVGY
ncbi:MAG: hypothetical protein H0V06_01595 [Gemmatimonadetes bacterium]|nr:hypothetical protein [Gemmatimonadota bacterium]